MVCCSDLLFSYGKPCHIGGRCCDRKQVTQHNTEHNVTLLCFDDDHGDNACKYDQHTEHIGLPAVRCIKDPFLLNAAIQNVPNAEKPIIV